MKSIAPLLLTLGALAMSSTSAAAEEKKGGERVFEMRTYIAAPGKMKELHTRFKEHTCKIFKKHGMEIVGFWVPTKPEDAEQKLVYLLAFPSREAADRAWAAFRADPEWKAAKAASEKNGTLVKDVKSEFLKATDYSPIK